MYCESGVYKGGTVGAGKPVDPLTVGFHDMSSAALGYHVDEELLGASRGSASKRGAEVGSYEFVLFKVSCCEEPSVKRIAVETDRRGCDVEPMVPHRSVGVPVPNLILCEAPLGRVA